MLRAASNRASIVQQTLPKKKIEPQRPLVIERPDLQTLPQRWGYRSVTVFCWLLWLYLFVPLLSFFAWVLGLSFAYRLLLQDLDVDELWSVLSFYATGIAVFAGIFLLWAFYSYMRFRGVERRMGSDAIQVDALAASHGLPTATVLGWQQEKKQTIDGETLAAMFDPDRAPIDEAESD